MPESEIPSGAAESVTTWGGRVPMRFKKKTKGLFGGKKKESPADRREDTAPEPFGKKKESAADKREDAAGSAAKKHPQKYKK